jgi:hypothetical protein
MPFCFAPSALPSWHFHLHDLQHGTPSMLDIFFCRSAIALAMPWFPPAAHGGIGNLAALR